ncbi:DUF4123 domain-containing protein [Photobacterium nomapromontoriensis]|uniref:DUF4123 domain-containing protein n=1 Tax=Photobacterium nomapromontoriensis TaxID=2910237 RepID=UPI003D10F5D5
MQLVRSHAEKNVTQADHSASVTVAEQALAQWLADVPLSDQIYAVVSGVCETEPFERYQALEPRPHFSPLYTIEPYDMWLDVMPRLVAIEKESPFLDWCAAQPSREWGWLLSSPLPAHTLVDYFSGLTQVKTQQGKAVFFRYWDGHFFNIICNVIGDEMAHWLPVVNRYWVNGISYTTPATSPVSPPQVSLWWTLPRGLMEAIAHADPAPVIANLLQFIKEEKAHLYFSFPEPAVRAKVTHFYHRWQQQEAHCAERVEDNLSRNNNVLLSALCQSLSDDMIL